MSSAPGVDDKDPFFLYLVNSPDPMPTITEAALDLALSAVRRAAGEATKDAAGNGTCWTPGVSVVVVGHGKEQLCEGFGRTQVKTGGPVLPETLFPCASLSKPVSATLLAHAGVAPKLEPGKPDPADTDPWDVSSSYSLVDEFDRRTSLNTTLRQWLSHRSGLPDHAGDLIEDLNPPLSQGKIFDILINEQTGIDTSHPFDYTNFGFTMGCLGAMKTVAAEPTWEAASARWFRELGLEQSTYAFTSAFSDEKRAWPHVGKPERSTALLEVDRTGWTWRINRDHERNPARQAPAGGLISSARDLGRLLLHLLTTKYVDYPPQDPPEEDLKGHRYSLGWNVKNPGRADVSFSHSGAFSLGAGTCMRFDPLSGFGVAVLSNGEPTGVPEALMALFFNTLYGSQLPSDDVAGLFAVARPMTMGLVYPTKIANYAKLHDLPTEVPEGLPTGGTLFVGDSRYYAGKVAIVRAGAGLAIRLGNAGNGGMPLVEFPLRCVDKTKLLFVYETSGENEIGPSLLQLVQKDGLIVEVLDAWLNGSGPGLGRILAQSAAHA
jgi:CubicO group peptidase (beta-lactamase class C family)